MRNEGFVYVDYAKDILAFCKNCRDDHGDRTAVLKAIRRYLVERGELTYPVTDMSEEAEKEVLHRAAQGCGGTIKQNPHRWTSGLHDPDLTTLKRFRRSFLFDIGTLVESPGHIAQDRLTIARTLTLIQLLPSPNNLIVRADSAETTTPPITLKNDNPQSFLCHCWQEIITHPAYLRRTGKGFAMAVNQHCMNRLYRKFGDCPDLVMQPERLGWLRQAIEYNDPEAFAWKNTWSIFYYLTTQDKECKYIWFEKFYAYIWGNKNEPK